MSKHVDKSYFYDLPSGNKVHPCRFIFKDGTIMWKHVFLCNNEFTALPTELSHEHHIIKTAQRLEELNVWVSQKLEPWECLVPFYWYDPANSDFCNGISVRFRHSIYSANHIFKALEPRVQPHETLELQDNCLLFKRC